jgi:nucleoside-diphosphate-sugar epimerase
MALLLLSWPGLERTGSHATGAALTEAAWASFLEWAQELAAAAAANDISIWGVGSGIESVTAGSSPHVGEPYLSYGRRKAEILELLRQQPHLTVNWLRLHFLFGPGEGAHRFVPAAIAAATSGRALPLGAPARLRHWLHVDDAARFLLQAIDQDLAGEWDIAGPEPVSFADFCGVIGTAVGAPLQIVAPGSPGADAHCPLVPTRRIPAFVPPDAGSLAYLLNRLRTDLRVPDGSGPKAG